MARQQIWPEFVTMATPLAGATPGMDLVLYDPPAELESGRHTMHGGALPGGGTVPLYYLQYYFVLTRPFAYYAHYAGNGTRGNARR